MVLDYYYKNKLLLKKFVKKKFIRKMKKNQQVETICKKMVNQTLWKIVAFKIEVKIIKKGKKNINYYVKTFTNDSVIMLKHCFFFSV